MADLTADRLVDTKVVDALQGGIVVDFSMSANLIYKGSFLQLDGSGDVIGAGTAGVCVGIALEQVDNSGGSGGDLTMPTLVGGVLASETLTATKTNIDDPIFCSDDQTLTLTALANTFVGFMTQIVGTNLVMVQMVSPRQQSSAYVVTNGTTDRTYDADTVAVAELADIVATLIVDLQAIGLLA